MQRSIRQDIDSVIADNPKLFLEVCKNYKEEEVEGKKRGDGVGLWEWLDVLGIHVFAFFSYSFLEMEISI